MKTLSRRIAHALSGVEGCVACVVLFLASSEIALRAQQPSWQAPPKLVVGIVVDQMRPDYIYRYWDNFGDGGFKRLIGEGVFLRDAHYTYIPTVTGPGHASIYTGSIPAFHGVVENDRYDRDKGKMVYCVNDSTVRGVGGSAQRSPTQLLATTLADEIERRTDRKGKTIGVALKDRSSILPIGRTGDAAYWFASNGSFITSSWYMDSLPAWATAFNGRHLAEEYLNVTWEPLLPIEKYHQVLPDQNPFEAPLVAGGKSSFPYNLKLLSGGPAGLGLIASTPWGNTLTTEMALAALAGEGMGTDAITDLLAISYSSTDILGHKVGPRAIELEDMYIRLDREIARLLTELDKRVGIGRYTLFLTADHGVVDVPAYLDSLKASAGYVDMEPIRREINSALAANDAQDSVAYIGDGQVFLVDRKDPAVHLSFMARPMIVRDILMQQPQIAAAWPATNLQFGLEADNSLMGLAANGYMQQRCGDVLYALRPGYFEASTNSAHQGTTHSSGWNYDTHVPVLFFGQGIAHREVVRRTAVADIAPTIAMIVGCALPDAAVGVAVPEAIK